MANYVEILLCDFGLYEYLNLIDLTITLLSDEKTSNVDNNLKILG